MKEYFSLAGIIICPLEDDDGIDIPAEFEGIAQAPVDVDDIAIGAVDTGTNFYST